MTLLDLKQKGREEKLVFVSSSYSRNPCIDCKFTQLEKT